MISTLAFAQEYRDVIPGVPLKFPEDLYLRPDYRVQWWYFTGHLLDDAGREFGYELTFFVLGVQKREYTSEFGVDNIYVSHFAVSDVQGKSFFFSDKADAGAYGFAGAMEKELKVWVGKDMLEGSVKEMHIAASDAEKEIDLTLVPLKPPVLQGEAGYSRKSEESPLIASYYFSYTDLKTEGFLKIGKTKFSVSGKSWFDREISTRGLGKNEKGWDWFSIQLDDGREIMLYLIRKSDGTAGIYSSGTMIYKDGKYRRLSLTDFKVRVLAHYKSKKTGARYPSLWRINVPSESLDLEITPLLPDQEFSGRFSTGNYYWEGTCRVEGTAKGRAYVEMTGY